MHEFIIYFATINFSKFILIFISTFLVYYTIIRKFVLNLFDPLFIFIVFNVFSSSLVLYMYLSDDIKHYYFLSYFSSLLFFWSGYSLVHKIYFTNTTKKEIISILHSLSTPALKENIILLAMILLLSSSFLFAFRGVPILSDNPSDAKVLLYEGGFGPVRYIQMVYITILMPISVIALFTVSAIRVKRPALFRKSILLYQTILVLCIATMIIGGSKGGLLGLVTAMSLVVFYKNMVGRHRDTIRIYSFTFLFLLMAISYMVLVSFLTTGDVRNVPEQIAIRSLASGDVFFFYYYFPIAENFSGVSLLDYFSYISKPILAILRLAETEYPLGAILLNLATNWPLGSFGPNAQFPVVADIYFGPMFSWVYAFVLGSLVAFLRVGLPRYLSKNGTLGVLAYFFFFFSAAIIPVDFIYFLQTTFMFVLLVLPIWLFLAILRQGQKITSIKYCND